LLFVLRPATWLSIRIPDDGVNPNHVVEDLMNQKIRQSVAHAFLVIGFAGLISQAVAYGQDKPAPAKRDVSQAAKTKIPIVRVTPRPSVNELPNLATRTKRPINRDLRIPPAPPPLTDGARTNLLRDSGVSVTISNSPGEFFNSY
jgi:hypothetical protein